MISLNLNDSLLTRHLSTQHSAFPFGFSISFSQSKLFASTIVSIIFFSMNKHEHFKDTTRCVLYTVCTTSDFCLYVCIHNTYVTGYMCAMWCIWRESPRVPNTFIHSRLRAHSKLCDQPVSWIHRKRALAYTCVPSIYQYSFKYLNGNFIFMCVWQSIEANSFEILSECSFSVDLNYSGNSLLISMLLYYIDCIYWAVYRIARTNTVEEMTDFDDLDRKYDVIVSFHSAFCFFIINPLFLWFVSFNTAKCIAVQS